MLRPKPNQNERLRALMGHDYDALFPAVEAGEERNVGKILDGFYEETEFDGLNEVALTFFLTNRFSCYQHMFLQ